MPEKSLYDTLGLRPEVSQKEIKKAYQNIARKHHPDKSKNPTTVVLFREAKEAYEILIDEEKRSDYDIKNKFNLGYIRAGRILELYRPQTKPMPQRRQSPTKRDTEEDWERRAERIRRQREEAEREAAQGQAERETAQEVKQEPYQETQTAEQEYEKTHYKSTNMPWKDDDLTDARERMDMHPSQDQKSQDEKKARTFQAQTPESDGDKPYPESVHKKRRHFGARPVFIDLTMESPDEDGVDNVSPLKRSAEDPSINIRERKRRKEISIKDLEDVLPEFDNYAPQSNRKPPEWFERRDSERPGFPVLPADIATRTDAVTVVQQHTVHYFKEVLRRMDSVRGYVKAQLEFAENTNFASIDAKTASEAILNRKEDIDVLASLASTMESHNELFKTFL